MMRRSLILDTTVRLMFDGALVLSIYLLFAGHNQPGGGFVGGLVAALAIALRYIAGGLDDVDTLLRFRPWTWLALGLALAAGSALWPLAIGDAPLDHAYVTGDVEILGHLSFSVATVFDTGVYLIVVSLVLMILEALGGEFDIDAEPAAEVAP